jgi:DNA-binding transcriptional regulator YdaS (Cro superfamily)
MNFPSAFARAIRIAGSECKLAQATGYSQVAINKAKRRGSVSPAMALAVHRFTGGAVPASALRPDLWARPQDVPVVDGPIIGARIAPAARETQGRAMGRAP